jgi:hypothetical protein
MELHLNRLPHDPVHEDPSGKMLPANAVPCHCWSEWLFKVVLLLVLFKPHLNREVPALYDVSLATHMKYCTSPVSWVPECHSSGGGNWRAS